MPEAQTSGPVHISEILPDVLERLFGGPAARRCHECGEGFRPETRFERVCARCRGGGDAGVDPDAEFRRAVARFQAVNGRDPDPYVDADVEWVANAMSAEAQQAAEAEQDRMDRRGEGLA